ncbi:hypothetical protein [Pseudarthrobacter sp. fls2-241-R2A-127]|uniref:hypothetical protein n=1 Tax=Pseudarthrobacter sp. fls2-241-R2A-127 TaxID=3040303 RepID=UPI002557BF2D|nr:hypothetical protein [Pseudarthrobacter sp. fls2-241-R2A-127]
MAQQFMNLHPGPIDSITELPPNDQFTASAIFRASNAQLVPMRGTVTAESENMYRFLIEKDGESLSLWAMKAVTKKG